MTVVFSQSPPSHLSANHMPLTSQQLLPNLATLLLLAKATILNQRTHKNYHLLLFVYLNKVAHARL